MKKIFVILLICILAAATIAVVKKTVDGNAKNTHDEAEQLDSPLVCVFYANTFLSIDKNGMVCENNASKPADQPVVEGVEFTKLNYGKKAQTADEDALEYVLKIAMCLNKYQVEADRISYADRKAVIHIGKLDIELGKNDKTDEKISDLSNFVDRLIGGDGTLYMQNANANNYGYTYRAR